MQVQSTAEWQGRADEQDAGGNGEMHAHWGGTSQVILGICIPLCNMGAEQDANSEAEGRNCLPTADRGDSIPSTVQDIWLHGTGLHS